MKSLLSFVQERAGGAPSSNTSTATVAATLPPYLCVHMPGSDKNSSVTRHDKYKRRIKIIQILRQMPETASTPSITDGRSDEDLLAVKLEENEQIINS
ncbi:hypothetical protein ATY81_17610 [Rhizobium sp. R72]|uniref:hypothetical protein n=1 Tax=unclassified Rhizobium TaxID=2613769 RepID=UPI000B537EDC|nr:MULTISPECIES: hypothetical protein [unclassified Rhizobium]OWW04140.1 hypothetical protein ATY81_17610 [Rhizobium sp. R72]OWW04343.1 hypothetical protein ATY80_17610 [Rhizobium sp. R711]